MELTATDTKEIQLRIETYLREVGKTIPPGQALDVKIALVPQSQIIIAPDGETDPLTEYGEKPIGFLNLNNHIQGAFERDGRYRLIKDLIGITNRSDLLVRNLGHKSIRVIREKLQSLGFKLGFAWILPRAQNAGWKPDVSA